ncbi:gamma-glutamyl-gamma-aminobutyrate hydrolase [Micromonospora qiuiae]|uniref:Gamma-glutamyl-gamma-aminobutyrate hydrolase n=1 Tax=Micromonospora qiuiae TaxID=502268 RepID=A0ABQ4JFA0_9ACTN|nr:gamma-glutamyl-gamma-aminobutyrate hydrolase family protein [Micromonospora qiuiae]GIJ28776.1 gamma-glutamyl-gamma-aminobutyrate hydrolase [Micromonospora qiuiae]
MTSRPLVGLLAHGEHLDGVAYTAVRDAYVEALADVAECQVVVLPTRHLDLARCPDWLDGVALGGHQSNVAPEHYGGPRTPGEEYDPGRDAAAFTLLRAAIAAGRPVIGICRGLQELNVALGGTLRTLADGRHREDLTLPRDEQYLPVHDVRIASGGLLHDVLGAPVVAVNSLHGQAIDVLAKPLRVEARAADGVVEAASRPGPAFCLGVQWHPEWYASTDAVSRRIFEAFGAACRGEGAGRHAG